MDYFPAFMQLDGKPCLVVGGGKLALRKTRLLLAAHAQVRIVAPETCAALQQLVHSGAIRHTPRVFDRKDVRGSWLVISASGRPDVDQQVYDAATDAGVFCNCVDDRDRCSFITPAIVDRGAVVVAVSSGGRAPVLARQIRAQIEALLPAAVGRLAGLAGRWRDRVRQSIADVTLRQRFWETVFNGRVAAEMYAGREAHAETALAGSLYRNSRIPASPGTGWLVGAGPGDPGLLTLRALQCMQTADVILYDRLVSAEVLALLRRDAERIAVGKTPGGPSTDQADINALLVRLVSEGKRVCRLKGGDPLVFGRGGEEAAALAAAGLPFEIVAGVTAASGCAAAAAVPLTQRGLAQAVTLLSACSADDVERLDWPALASANQTLVVYMGVRRYPEIMRKLVAAGRRPDTAVAIVEKGSTAEQRIVRGTLGQLALLSAAHGIQAPALLFIGETAALDLSQTPEFSATESSTTYSKALHS